jgi:hypothetical protein
LVRQILETDNGLKKGSAECEGRVCRECIPQENLKHLDEQPKGNELMVEYHNLDVMEMPLLQQFRLVPQKVEASHIV